MLRLLVLALACTATLVAADGAGKGRGFGDDYDWKTSEEAFSDANTKPIMVVVHRTWCGACKALAPQFASSDKIKKLADQFTMINFDESDDPEKWQYDGGYIPRVLFLTPKGEDMSHIINAGGNPKYKYYYTSPEQIVTSMEQALKEVEAASEAADSSSSSSGDDDGEADDEEEAAESDEDGDAESEEEDEVVKDEL